MNINLHNYESLFLLYVDNELSAAERATVDAFIEEHPYLGQELQLLQGMVLPAGDAVVIDKNNLYRSSAIGVNMEEAMLLQLDAELPDASAQALMQQIDHDEALQQNWQQLLKTRLPEEDIVFRDKASLYRKEQAAIVSFRFVKWAVAAALLAAGLFTAVMLLRQQAQTGAEFAISPAKEQNNRNTNSGNEGQESPKGTAPIETVVATELAKQDAEPKVLSDDKDAPISKARLVTNIATKELADAKLPAVIKNKPIIKSVEKEQASYALTANNKTVKLPEIDHELSMSTSLAANKVRPAKEIIDTDIAATKQSFAKLAVLEEEAEDNHILGIEAETVGRTKAGVFFKKLKRTVARSANIKTGNSLKIAGFEFAVK